MNFNLVFLVTLSGVVFVVIFMFLPKVWYHVVFSEMYHWLLTGCHLGFSRCVCHLKNSYVFLVQSIVVEISTKSSTLGDWQSIGCASSYITIFLSSKKFSSILWGPETRLCTPKIGGSGSRPMWCTGPLILRTPCPWSLLYMCELFAAPQMEERR